MDAWLMQWLENNRDQALWLVPLLAFAEAAVGLGLFVSGVLLLLALLALFRQETPWRRRILLGYGLVVLVGIAFSPANRSLVAVLSAPLVLLGALQMMVLAWWTWQS